MTKKEWQKKLTDETHLTAEETLILEERLDGQSGVKQMVASLENPEPSLAWRSALNAELMKVAPAPRKRFNWMAWGSGALATGVACFAVLALVPRGVPDVPAAQAVASGALAEDLIQGHETDSVTMAVGIAAPDLDPVVNN